MEASVAAGAGSAGSAGAEDAGASQEGAEGAEGQQGGLDLAPLREHIDSQFDQRFGALEQRLDGLTPPAEGEGEGEGDGPLAGLDPNSLYDDQGEVDPQAAQQFLGDLTSQAAQQAVQEAVAPVMEELFNLRVANNARALQEQYPEYKDPEQARGLMDQALQRAQGLGLNEQDAAGVVTNPAFLELVIKAGKADQLAKGEPAGQRSEMELESGGTAGQARSEQDVQQGIAQAKPRNDFWT